jgi:hypothetical protein
MKKTKPVVFCLPHNLARQRGASLLEGIAYLGIAALVVLGAVSLLTGAFGSAKANQTTEEVVALRTSVRKLYAGQPYNADSAMMANLVTAKAIPNTLVVTGAAAVNNGWSGAVTLAGESPSTFTITYTLVPQDVCVSVVSGANGWAKITGAAGANPIATFPVNATSASALCAADTNTIIFTAT